MKMERTASHSRADTAPVASAAVQAPARRFAPVNEYEATIFAALTQRENAGPGAEGDRKSRLPRFSLLRGEVALLAERCWPKGRKPA